MMHAAAATQIKHILLVRVATQRSFQDVVGQVHIWPGALLSSLLMPRPQLLGLLWVTMCRKLNM